MPPGGPFTYEDLVRWPSGAEATELYDGALLYSGQFIENDVAVARRTYPDHQVRLDARGLWILPAGTDTLPSG